jgi:hypothetical protein
MVKPDTDKFAAALGDPTSVFSEPEAVLSRQDIPREMKIEILRRWEYDARELSVAENEGMGGGPPSLLRRVQAALRSIDSGPEQPQAAPTKEGGL